MTLCLSNPWMLGLYGTWSRMALQPLILLGRERAKACSDAPATDPALELLPGFSVGVAAGEQLAHAVEIGVCEHFADGGFQVFFEELDNPAGALQGVQVDAAGMVALEAAALAPGMRRSQRDKADAADLPALPHPCR